MISNGSCDSEDWSKFSFAITEINYMSKHIKIENCYFTLEYFTILPVFFFFLLYFDHISEAFFGDFFQKQKSYHRLLNLNVKK